MDKVKELVETLSEKIDELPVDIQEKLKQIADNDNFEINNDWLKENGYNPKYIDIETSKEGVFIASVNKALKRVRYFSEVDGLLVFDHEYPESFKMKCEKTGRVIVEW